MGSGSSKAFKQDDEITVPDIPKSGVTLSFLHRLRELQVERGWPDSTEGVVNSFVKPEAEALRMLINEASKAAQSPVKSKKGEVEMVTEVFVGGSSFASVMKRNHSDTVHPSLQMTYSQCYGEKATVFVTHAWNSPFSELVAALDGYVTEQQKPSQPTTSSGKDADKDSSSTYLFWIDAFLMDQWATVPPAQYPIEWYTDVFPAFVAQIGRTVMVMSPGPAPVVLKRSWCIWEAVCTLKQQQQQQAQRKGQQSSQGQQQMLHLALSDEARASFVAALEQDFDGTLQTWTGNSVDIASSLSTHAGDREMILTALDWDSHERTFYQSRIDAIQGPAPGTSGKQLKKADRVELARLTTLLEASIAKAAKEGLDGVGAAFAASNALVASRTRQLIAETLAGITKAAMKDGASADELNKATTTLERALKGYEAALGTEHPDTLAAAHHCALLFNTLAEVGGSSGIENATTTAAIAGLLKKARRHSERALQGREKLLGPNHPETLRSVDQLSVVLTRANKLKDAKKLTERAMEGREKVLGELHPDTLTSIYNNGVVLWKQGKWDEAKWMYLKSLEGREKVLGELHADTLQVMHSLGVVYKQLDKWKEAKMYYERCLDGREKALGKEHPDTLTTQNALGIVLTDNNLLNEAKVVYDACLAGREKTLGPAHVETLKTAYNLAIVMLKQYQRGAAKVLFKRCFDGFVVIYGPNHPETTDAQRQLDGLAGF